MKAIFFKELRENSKWAVGIFLIFGVIIYLQIRVPSPSFLFVVARPLGPILLTVVIFGALLGVAQSVFEIRSDNWAFAVHRPVPRLAVFVGKATAGLLLLYAALAIPLALAVAWVATPVDGGKFLFGAGGSDRNAELERLAGKGALRVVRWPAIDRPAQVPKLRHGDSAASNRRPRDF